MSFEQRILEGVQLDEQHRSTLECASLDERLGFLVISQCKPSVEGDRYLTLIGFGVSGWQRGSNEVGDVIEPITDYDALAALGDESLTSIDRIGNGVGPRLLQYAASVSGYRKNPRRIGAYKLWLDASNIWDYRLSIDPKTPAGLGIRVAKHAYYRAHARLLGERRTASHIHTGHLQRAALLHHQTPQGFRLEKQRGAPASAVHEAFIVIRNPDLRAYKIGEYIRPGAGAAT